MTDAARVRFGAVIGIREFGRIGDDAAEIEALGYDSAWVSEHILFWIPILDGPTALAAMAARTTSIDIGTAIYLLPLRHPLITAKAFSTVDVVSKGRAILGAGIGGEFVPEFEALEVPVTERGRRADEAIEAIRLLWRGERVSYNGRYYRFSDVIMEPPPARPGGPPIWVAGRSEAAMRRAALLGDGYMPYLFDAPRFRDGLDRVRQIAAGAGRNPSDIVPAIYQHISLGDTYEAARATAVRELTRLYDRPFDDIADRFAVIGTPEQCAEQLRAFIGAGARHLILAALGPGAEMDSYRAYARDLIPLLRANQ